jgi:hemoglobin-like flavoprotein
VTEEQIKLVRDSFDKAIARREDFAEFFYACLFDLSPDMRALFKGDIDSQARRFMEMVAVAVNGMTMEQTISPALEMLGTSHRNIEIETSHYAPFGQALVWSLAQTLENDFTPETRRAWEDWYELVAQTMAAARGKPV